MLNSLISTHHASRITTSANKHQHHHHHFPRRLARLLERRGEPLQPTTMSGSSNDSSPSETLHDVAASWHPRPISVAVNPVALVVTECITVTSAMRKHARWAHSSVSAILGGSSNKTPAIQKRDRAGQGIVSGEGQQEEAVPSRWGLRGKKGKSMQDNPLMSAFALLRNELKGCKGAC